MSIRFSPEHWALILGGSSGFGLATARKLARCGMSVAVVHRDRRGAMATVEREFAAIRESGGTLVTFNKDALDDTSRSEILDQLAERLGSGAKIRVLLHSIAFGNLKPLAPSVGAAEPELLLEDEDFARTVYSMGTSLSTWTRAVFERGLFAADARVLGLTSEGNQRVWRGYAAVSAAKAALEAMSRAIAVEYGAHGIRSNIVQAGVADTPALRHIPASAGMMSAARAKNPLGRLTEPEDVADVISLLCSDEARFINGALIRVDGGESIAS